MGMINSTVEFEVDAEYMDKKIHELRLYLGLLFKAFGEAIGYTGSHILRIKKIRKEWVRPHNDL